MATESGVINKLVRAIPLVVLDVAATIISYLVGAWGTHVLGVIFQFDHFALYVALLAVVNVVTFSACKMYSVLWEYASIDEAVRIVAATALAFFLGASIGFIVFGERLPFRLYAVGWVVFLVVCSASRFAIRISSGRRSWSLFGMGADGGAPRSLIIGAGETGSLTVNRMLAGNPDMPGCPVGLVDDDRSKTGRYIHGIKVLGTCDDIPSICSVRGIEQLVIAMPSSTKAERDRIYKICISTGIKTLTLPLISDLPNGLTGKIAMREVEISDLLSREEISLDLGKMGYVAGKRILVTGGGGSIGSELVRQLLTAKPAMVVLFDIYENTTYELYHEIAKEAGVQGVEIKVEIGSITHLPALRKCFEEYRPQVVFHAAAHKHVPLMENNPREAVENNVFGTLNVVKIAHENKCTHFVQISTDKAVNPANVMGATKRMDEMIIQYYAANSDTIFTAVRFGNVLGSHGSVIPLFRRQLKNGGPITVTHRDITRYFMTIPEASRLVIAAGALAHGGEVFVLNMGDPVKVYDLAVNLVTLSGLRPGRDIEIVETGLRPGEKMYEELQMDTERLIETDNKDIRISVADALAFDDIEKKLAKLEASLDEGNAAIKRTLAEVVPTYCPSAK